MCMYVEADESGRAEVKSWFSVNIRSYHATKKTNKVFDVKEAVEICSCCTEVTKEG